MKRLAIYLAISFGLTWGIVIPAGVATGAYAAGEAAAPIMIPILAAIMFAPLVGAVTAQRICRPHDMGGLGYLPRIKGNVRCYLAAWLVPAALALAGAGLFFGLNPQWFDPGMTAYVAQMAGAAGVPAGQATEQLTPGLLAATIAFSVLAAPFINMIPAFGEEIGWRGFLFPALCEHMTPRAAALASGAVWGLWHAPIIAMGHHYGMGYPGFPLMGILTMTIACVSLGSILSHLRVKAGSVWPCALAHGAVNATVNIGVLFSAVGPTPFGPNPLGLVAGIPLFILAIVCWLHLDRA